MDKIILNNLRFYGYVGCLAEEKERGQYFTVDIDIEKDLSRAGEKDDLAETVNYAEIYRHLHNFFQDARFELLEATAENMAEMILADFSVPKVKVTLTKEKVPVTGTDFSAKIILAREKNTVYHQAYLGLGSNLGNKLANIQKARNLLRAEKEVIVLRQAGLYETDPLGYTDQDKFLNTVLEIKTTLSPWELLLTVKKIEKKMGREKKIRWGPRNIDVDILLYEDRKIVTGRLTVPHREMENRLFVLLPLSELEVGLSEQRRTWLTRIKENLVNLEKNKVMLVIENTKW